MDPIGKYTSVFYNAKNAFVFATIFPGSDLPIVFLLDNGYTVIHALYDARQQLLSRPLTLTKRLIFRCSRCARLVFFPN